jgi:hypothetical protein
MTRASARDARIARGRTTDGMCATPMCVSSHRSRHRLGYLSRDTNFQLRRMTMLKLTAAVATAIAVFVLFVSTPHGSRLPAQVSGLDPLKAMSGQRLSAQPVTDYSLVFP